MRVRLLIAIYPGPKRRQLTSRRWEARMANYVKAVVSEMSEH